MEEDYPLPHMAEGGQEGNAPYLAFSSTEESWWSIPVPDFAFRGWKELKGYGIGERSTEEFLYPPQLDGDGGAAAQLFFNSSAPKE
jgi:hypothetical protein